VGNGVSYVSKTGKALGVFADQVSRIDSLVSQIATATQAQSAALSQVNFAVNHMDRLTQQNASLAEKTTASAHSMRDNATQLLEQIGDFRASTGQGREPFVQPELTRTPRTYAPIMAQNRL